MQHVMDDKLYITQGISSWPQTSSFRLFEPEAMIKYEPYCDDFGPLNMASIALFIEQLESELHTNPTCRVFYCAGDGRRSLTNAVFLLGSYMILRHDKTLEEVSDCFSWMSVDQHEEYRDATFVTPTFRLSLLDCWGGLVKGICNRWVEPPDGEYEEDFWGMIDIAEYAHYDSPLNGDLHEVVPGKFVAFRGPEELGGAEYLDDARGFRRFSPSFYVDVLKDLGVTTVVRLNEAHYDAACFEREGIKVVELEFEDCTAPPAHVVEAFFAAADGTDGSVAVHCKAGLGRTGTLIGLWLMRRRGFTAREAMGWLRIMRPGSVIGEQQHYLCCCENKASDQEDGQDIGEMLTLASSSEQNASDVAAAMERRAAERVRGGAGSAASQGPSAV